MSGPAEFLGLSADQFFAKIGSLADVRSHVALVIEQPDKYGIPSENAERAANWLSDFQSFKFEEEPFHVYPQTKEYQHCGTAVPVHSPLESLAYAMSLVEPPDNAMETNWYESWAVCVARLVGTASRAQAPSTLSLLHPSPWFKLPATWNSKYLVGTAITVRMVDFSGHIIPEVQEAGEKRSIVQRERYQFAVQCGSEVSGQTLDASDFDARNGFPPLTGRCAVHMPSCVILKTISPGNATHFKRMIVKVDEVAKAQNSSFLKREDYLEEFFQDSCINCVDGYCNPAGLAAAKLSKSDSASTSW